MNERALPLALTVLLGLVLLALMYAGWRRRARSQREVAAPPAAVELLTTVLGPLPATYVSTTRAGDWLDRIVPHTLGQRSAAQVSIGTARTAGRSSPQRGNASDHGRGLENGHGNGHASSLQQSEQVIVVERPGAVSFCVPRSALDSVHSAPGMAGKFVGSDRLVVLRWDLGGTAVDTGLHLRSGADRAALREALAALAGTDPTSGRQS